MTDANISFPLRVNSPSPFSIHHAIWPFFGLISLMITVWLLVYISTAISRRRHPKIQQNDSATFYATQERTTVAGHETSTGALATDV